LKNFSPLVALSKLGEKSGRERLASRDRLVVTDQSARTEQQRGRPVEKLV